jgi:membrane associated rhomboid family serine protease
MATRSSYQSNRKILLGQDNNALVFLFAINTLMFVIVNFIKIVYYLSDTPIDLFYSQVLNWLSLPAQGDVLATRPWTILSYMITHHSIWQLISSMLWLWCFGYILQDLAGNNKLIPIYIYGGLISSVVFLVMNNTVPVLSAQLGSTAPLLGAGGAVMAIAVATTTLAPDYRIFPLINGGIPLWVLTLIFVIIDFASLASNNAGIGAGHLAAGIVGFIFIQQLRKGRDLGAWMNRFASWTNDLFNPEKKQQQAGNRHFYKASREPFQKQRNVTQQRLDEILDKINQEGYHYLTEEEKAFLKKASSELNDN